MPTAALANVSPATDQGGGSDGAAVDSSGCGSEHLHGGGGIALLESRLAAYYGMKHALALSSATSGLFAIALALKVRGREVIAPPLSWGGTLAGPLQLGARPVFADVEPSTLALSPESVGHRITRRTRLIVGVDLFGVPADDVGLRRVADDHGLWYIHDAAQSFGARRNGRPSGAAAHATVVSFSSGKALDAGEGGAVLTNDAELYQRLVWLTQHPYRQKRDLGLGLQNEFGLNCRMHPLAASLAVDRFELALEGVKQRQRQAAVVIAALEGSGLTEPLRYTDQGLEPSFPILSAAWARGPEPEQLVLELHRHRLSATLSEVNLRPLYRHAGYQLLAPGSTSADCPVAEDQVTRRFQITAVASAPQEGANR